tara:strand:- start:6672 stop:7016 length:345 start_codon:yes stop_codon:yes gene_type:complete
MSNLTVTTLTNQDIQLCKAWVNFNGTGTVAIRSSLNVSSITDNGVGDYTVNFTNNMADANYAVAGGATTTVDAGNYNPVGMVDRLISSFRVDVEAAGGTQNDGGSLIDAIVFSN